MRRLLAISALSLTLGCQTPSAAPVVPTTRSTRAVPTPAASQAPAQPATPASQGQATAVLEAARQLGAGEALRAVQLVGKVKLISDKGSGILSNNAAGLISNNGGGLVSSGGGSYRALAAAAEALLADATIEVLDAEGRRLVAADGKPITAVSDGQGGYRLEAALPAENMVLRVRLFPRGGGPAGELLAMLPIAKADASQPLAQDIDTASSFSAAYVLDQYVKGSRQVYDRLPLAEAQALQQEVAKARAASGQVPSYDRKAQVEATQALRAQTPALDQKLTAIKVLLIGQADLGNGLAATRVALTTPIAVTGDARGNLYIAEGLAGRVRHVGPDGVIQTVGAGSRFTEINGLAMGPDGALVVSERATYQLLRLGLDGAITPLAGTTAVGDGSEVDKPAAEAALGKLHDVSVGPDGAIYYAQAHPHLRYRAPDGMLRALPLPPGWEDATPMGIAVAADGAIAVAEWTKDRIALKLPGGAWRALDPHIPIELRSRLTFLPDGSLAISETLGHRLWKLGRDGTKTLLAGTGTSGAAGDGGPATGAQLSYPAGLWSAPDGTLYVADYGNGLVRAIKDGQLRTVAGTTGVSQQGDTAKIALNGPVGLARDPQGRLVIAEGGTGTIKRLEGENLTVIAGTSKGYSGDGGPATSARLESLSGIAYAGERLVALCNQSPRVRVIDAEGIIQTWAAKTPKGLVMSVAAGPDGRIVMADTRLHVVRELVDATTTRDVAGQADTPGEGGDGGPAAEAHLNSPFGVTFDAQGNLYIADAGNGQIRKVASDGTISVFAGLTKAQAQARWSDYRPGQDDGGSAREAVLIGPGAMTFDAAGNLYVCEVGTANLLLSGIPPSEVAGLPPIKARVRKIAPDGTITTVAGVGGKLLASEGDSLMMPAGIAIDGAGRLAISDAIANAVRLIPAGQY